MGCLNERLCTETLGFYFYRFLFYQWFGSEQWWSYSKQNARKKLWISLYHVLLMEKWSCFHVQSETECILVWKMSPNNPLAQTLCFHFCEYTSIANSQLQQYLWWLMMAEEKYSWFLYGLAYIKVCKGIIRWVNWKGKDTNMYQEGCLRLRIAQRQ